MPSPTRAEDMENDKDPMTASELAGSASTITKRPNAFLELMSASKKPKPSTTPDTVLTPPTKPKLTFDLRDGLGIYIQHPERNPEGLVVSYDDDFVVIRDKYPKASVHLLLLPRDPELWYEHPLDALSTNSGLLVEVKKRCEDLKVLVASELRRMYGQDSAADAPYQAALEELMSSAEVVPSATPERDLLLPSGRDWSQDVKVGVHIHPSMNHLHIHIFSRDMHSPCMKHKKHYLSFNSSFLVGLDELPLAEDDGRRRPGDWPSWDMRCWRCGRGFGNRFKALKRHLEEEWEVWRKE